MVIPANDSYFQWEVEPDQNPELTCSSRGVIKLTIPPKAIGVHISFGINDKRTGWVFQLAGNELADGKGEST